MRFGENTNLSSILGNPEGHTDALQGFNRDNPPEGTNTPVWTAKWNVEQDGNRRIREDGRGTGTRGSG